MASAAAAAMGTSTLNSIDVDADLDSPAAPHTAAAAAQETSTGLNGIAAYELPRSKGKVRACVRCGHLGSLTDHESGSSWHGSPQALESIGARSLQELTGRTQRVPSRG